MIPPDEALNPAFQTVWEVLERRIFPVRAGPRAFNQYLESHPERDLPEAGAMRRSNLRAYLACYRELPDVFVLAEAPGPWGCRFSGIPIVSEAQLLDANFPIDGLKTSRSDDPHDEYSAGIYWRVLQPYFPRFFTWNSFPFHPHRLDEPDSIRTPGLREIAEYTEVLRAMLAVLKPKRVVAVGRRAEYALGKADQPCIYVRHPSQGGARKFETGILSVMRR